MEKAGYVYIMASGKNGTIYIGVTSDLAKRAMSTARASWPVLPSDTVANGWFGSRLSMTFNKRGIASCR